MVGDEDKEHFTYAMQLVTTIAFPMVLSNAIKLKVLEAIAEAGPDARLPAHEIASRLSISNNEAPNILDRMLQLLASHSVVTCSEKHDHESKPVRLYGLAPVAKHFIPNKDGVSLAPLVDLIHDKFSIDSWFKIQDLVLEGRAPFFNVDEKSTFEDMGLNARLNAIFNKAMADTSTMVMKEVLECYNGFDNLKSLVDVGGGIGITLNMIISKHPTLKGINLDLPHVIKHAPLYPGIEHVGGDMFDYLPKSDGLLLKMVLHNWDDDHCVKLLKNCYKALPEDSGKVIVIEKIIPPIMDTSSYVKCVTHMDAIMLNYHGSKERTEDEFLALVKSSGFRGMRKKCFVYMNWVMEFYK